MDKFVEGSPGERFFQVRASERSRRACAACLCRLKPQPGQREASPGESCATSLPGAQQPTKSYKPAAQRALLSGASEQAVEKEHRLGRGLVVLSGLLSGASEQAVEMRACRSRVARVPLPSCACLCPCTAARSARLGPQAQDDYLG